MTNINLTSQSIAAARGGQRAITDQKVFKWRVLAPRRRGFQIILGMKPMARMAVARRRALAMYDLDRCCAIWWLYRLHFGFTGDVMLGLAAVTVAQKGSRCGI
ncbi:hypothetical protein QA649_36385 [Bradyrhizobium sp. CB1717]|uniref:hypothetical protein n=1 Tax=Bradyrhizobium sp. CB1717 TaxID=3039154 RepID=UPI0024B146FC|nr:hypothetical protein [Bradyrhizobium sp. CB1717]WFU23457.1 hypothetical protein QA649_36385 [Bradyrhizobium sp. CB1717]